MNANKDVAPQSKTVQKKNDHTSNNSQQPAFNKEIPINLQQLVTDDKGFVQTVTREIKLTIDPYSGDMVIAIVDGNKQDVVRHIPENETMAIERLIAVPTGTLLRAYV